MTDFTITFTVPDQQATDVLDNVTNALGYQNGGITRINFLRAHVKSYLKKIYVEEKKRVAIANSGTDAESAANAVSIT